MKEIMALRKVEETSFSINKMLDLPIEQKQPELIGGNIWLYDVVYLQYYNPLFLHNQVPPLGFRCPITHIDGLFRLISIRYLWNLEGEGLGI